MPRPGTSNVVPMMVTPRLDHMTGAAMITTPHPPSMQQPPGSASSPRSRISDSPMVNEILRCKTAPSFSTLHALLPEEWQKPDETQHTGCTLTIEPISRFLPAISPRASTASVDLSESALEARAYASASPRKLIPCGWSLKNESPRWWKLPAHAMEATKEFERDHRSALSKTCTAHHKLHTHAGSEIPAFNEIHWERSIWDLRWNRFTGDPKPPPTPKAIAPGKRRAKARAKFDLFSTFWVKRRDCDSEDLWDTDVCYAALVALDWKRAVEDGRIGRLVTRIEKRSGGDDDDEDGNELDDCEAVFREHAHLVYALYDEYSVLGASDLDDVYSVGRKSAATRTLLSLPQPPQSTRASSPSCDSQGVHADGGGLEAGSEAQQDVPPLRLGRESALPAACSGRGALDSVPATARPLPKPALSTAAHTTLSLCRALAHANRRCSSR